MRNRSEVARVPDATAPVPSAKHGRTATSGPFADGFLKGAAVLLLFTGTVKILTFFQETPYLSLRNALFNFLSNGQVVLLTGLLEMAVACYLFAPASDLRKGCAVAWLGTAFLAYRCALSWLGVPVALCPCLGHLGSWLGIREATVNILSETMLAYLLAGSYAILCSRWLHRSGPRRVLGRKGGGAPTPLIAVLASLLMWSSSGLAEGIVLHISGHVTYTGLIRGRVATQHERDFHLQTSGCRFAVQMTGYPRDEETGSEEYLFDGTNVFLTHRLFTTNFNEFQHFAREKHLMVHRGEKLVGFDLMHDFLPVTVTVKGPEDLLPDYDLSLILPVWLAYGSGCYFRSALEKSSLVERPFLCVYGIDKWRYPIHAAISLFGEAPIFFPSAVDYISDGVDYNLDQQSGHMKPSRWPAPYDHGFTEAEYRVGATTNVGDFVVPAEFAVTHYWPAPNGRSSNELATVGVFRGVARAVYLMADDHSFLLSIPAKTHVIDRRFSPSGDADSRLHMVYALQDGKIPPLSAVKSTRNYEALLAEQRPSKVGIKRRVMFAFFAVLAIAPIAVRIWVWRGKNKPAL
jgi:hypothetical protein